LLGELADDPNPHQPTPPPGDTGRGAGGSRDGGNGAYNLRGRYQGRHDDGGYTREEDIYYLQALLSSSKSNQI